MHLLNVFPLLYLDPGSGSILAQALAAGALGLGILVKVYWGKIKGVFGKKSEAAPETEESQDDETPDA